MKIIYLANFRMPTEKAHGLQVAYMCEAFAKNGNDVTLVIPYRKNLIKKDIFDYYGVDRLFNVIKIPSLNLIRFGKIGYFLTVLSFIILTRLFLFFKKYDLIYTRDYFFGLLFFKRVLELHFLPKNMGYFVKFLHKRASVWVSKTSFIKEELIKIGIKQEKILISGNGVNLSLYNLFAPKNFLREKIGLPLDKKIVLYSGTFYIHSWKGVDIFLESSKYLSKNILLVLVGGNKKEISEIYQKYLKENILALEKVSNNNLPLYIKSADVLVLPNKKGDIVSEKYTSPLKLYEYMASMVPVVASDLPSIREVVNEKEVYFVKPNDPKALACGIKFLLNHNDYGNSLSNLSAQKIKNFSWNKVSQRIINFIKEKGK